MSLRIKDRTSEQLHADLSHVGLKLSAARWIQAAALRRGEYPEPRPGLSAAVLAQVRRLTSIPHLMLVEKLVSDSDGFAKYLFHGDGPELFEAVRIPLLHKADDPKYVVCVSSQVGCAMGCAFCATGRMGWRRNLATWEIVDQVLKIQADSAHRVRGVVFMGMGEPLLNYDAVIRAARILSEPCGMAIAAKAITISTVGITPGIRRFTREGYAFRLVVSLNAADPILRAALMPVEETHPLPELMRAIREYQESTRRRVTLAWTTISGVNTRIEDARALAELTRDLPVKLDLIDVNDPTGRYRPPSRDELNLFRDALRDLLGMPVARRYSGGSEIHAACGMLAGGSGELAPPCERGDCGP
jgi:23S rRNA (adenine2503-C2)-methyltransferase